MASEHICFSQRWRLILGCRGLTMAGLACSLLVGSLSHADTVGYWRFGDDPNGFLADSGSNGLHLRQLDPNDVAGIPNYDPNSQADATQEAIPGSGPGSTFDDAVAGNTQLAHNFPGSNRGSGFVVDDDPVFTVSDFTIEALIHREADPNSKIPVWSIAGQFGVNDDYLGPANNRSWQFIVRDGETSSDFGQLRLSVAQVGTSGVNINSGSSLTLDPDKDYYVAASFDLSNQTDGVTFYAKDLTGGGPMQTAKLGHTLTSLFDATSPFWIASGINPWQRQGEGFLDEVRFSNVVLDPSELLVPDVNNGDFDGNGVVDGDDFLLWQRGRFTQSAEPSRPSNLGGQLRHHAFIGCHCGRARAGFVGAALHGGAGRHSLATSFVIYCPWSTGQAPGACGTHSRWNHSTTELDHGAN